MPKVPITSPDVDPFCLPFRDAYNIPNVNANAVANHRLPTTSLRTVRPSTWGVQSWLWWPGQIAQAMPASTHTHVRTQVRLRAIQHRSLRHLHQATSQPNRQHSLRPNSMSRWRSHSYSLMCRCKVCTCILTRNSSRSGQGAKVAQTCCIFTHFAHLSTHPTSHHTFADSLSN